MPKKHTLSVAAGKAIRHATKLKGNGGSALPGLVIEKISPKFTANHLSNLPLGVVVVVGTNGKTTTTKFIADSLELLGKKVLTNDTGSNYSRGIASKIIQEVKTGSKLPHDIAVIELDEIYATHFIKKIKPDYVLALNVMRDQLDRFGEIDNTAGYIKTVLQSAKKGTIINADDDLLTKLGLQGKKISYFGVGPKIRKKFPTDSELISIEGSQQIKYSQIDRTVTLQDYDENSAVFMHNNKRYTKSLKIKGGYNYQNAAAAAATLLKILPDIPFTKIIDAVAQVQPAFGRGEEVIINGKAITIRLVKNPGGFQQALNDHVSDKEVVIAINDNYADGRDVSWLYDVDFGNLEKSGVDYVSGNRAYDMAVRLKYEGVAVNNIDRSIEKTIEKVLSNKSKQKIIIYATYTCMLKIRSLLKNSSNIGGPL